jgi:hypothetical protein
MISSEAGEEELRRKDDEAYSTWLRAAAKEIAATLKELDPHRINQIIKWYDQYLDRPASLHVPLEAEEEETIKRLIGSDRLQNIPLLKTKALIFTPSILAPHAGLLDYGTAMYRRYSLHGLWFSVIAMNEEYLKAATRSMLHYMLEHQLAQGEIYAELAVHNVKDISTEMKGTVHEEARMKAIQWSCISSEEVERERQLIIELSTHHPLVPVHFASASLFKYLEENWDTVKQFGQASRNEVEKELEFPIEQLAAWADSAINFFKFFLKELKKEITMTGAEYGLAIV